MLIFGHFLRIVAVHYTVCMVSQQRDLFISLCLDKHQNNKFVSLTGSSYSLIGPQFVTDSGYQVGERSSTIMMPLSEVRTAGYITAFKLFGAAAGNIHIQVML